MIGGWVGGPCAGRVPGGTGVEVAAGVKVGVLVGVGGTGVAVGGTGVVVGEGVVVGVDVGSGTAVDSAVVAEGADVEVATKATTSGTGSTPLSNIVTRMMAAIARARNSNQTPPALRIPISVNSTGLWSPIPFRCRYTLLCL